MYFLTSEGGRRAVGIAGRGSDLGRRWEGSCMRWSEGTSMGHFKPVASGAGGRGTLSVVNRSDAWSVRPRRERSGRVFHSDVRIDL